MSVKEEIHAQIVGGLKDANFPIKTPADLLAAFPEGADKIGRASCRERV